VDPLKLQLDDLEVTTFAPAPEDGPSFLLTNNNQLACTGCDSGCGIFYSMSDCC
jgi:hypothetical protein